MSRSELPTDGELQALYREVAGDEPGPALDRRILDAARAEVQAVPSARPRQPWWRGWLPVTSAIAVAAVGLSLTWRVMDQQERELREEMNAASKADARPAKSMPAEEPAAARSRLDAPASAKFRGAEAEAARDSSPDLAAQPAARQAPLPAAPAPADEVATRAQSLDPDSLRERRDARPAAPAAPSAERQAGKLEAKRFGIGGDTAADALAPSAAKAVAGAAARSAEQAADAATPELWLQQIRDLRTAGRNAEAAQSLARFRTRYPDFVLPEDLLNPRGH